MGLDTSNGAEHEPVFPTKEARALRKRRWMTLAQGVAGAAVTVSGIAMNYPEMAIVGGAVVADAGTAMLDYNSRGTVEKIFFGG